MIINACEDYAKPTDPYQLAGQALRLLPWDTHYEKRGYHVFYTTSFAGQATPSYNNQ